MQININLPSFPSRFFMFQLVLGKNTTKFAHKHDN